MEKTMTQLYLKWVKLKRKREKFVVIVQYANSLCYYSAVWLFFFHLTCDNIENSLHFIAVCSLIRVMICGLCSRQRHNSHIAGDLPKKKMKFPMNFLT